jgi:hypothetical protein
MSRDVLEEKPAFAYSLARLVALSPLGRPVKLTDGRTVGPVVGLMQWPFGFQVKKRAYRRARRSSPCSGSARR